MPKLSPDISVRRGSGLVDRLMFGGQEVFDGIPAQVQSILNKYPQGDAHLFIPGIGQISNFSAGNYRQTDGVTGGQVDQTVGRVNDAAGKLGPELHTGFANWTFGAGWSALTATAANTTSYSGALLSVGKTYKVTYQISGYGGGSIKLYSPSNGYDGATNSANGVFTGFISVTLSASGALVFFPATPFTGTISNISVREVIGTHATQGTTANMPTLRKAGGLYSLEFDGTTDYLKLDAPLFGMADDHCVIAGVKSTLFNASVAQSVFTQGHSSNSAPLIDLGFGTAGIARFVARDGVGNLALGQDATLVNRTNNVVVLTGLKQVYLGTNNKVLRVNGMVKSAEPFPAAATTFDTCSLGIANGAGALTKPFPGNIYPIIAIKGTVSGADLLTLERWVGKMSGVTF